MALAPLSQIEVVDPNTVKLRGYAAIFGNEFTWFDDREWRLRKFVVEPGSFASVLERQGGEPLDVYWWHQTFKLQLGQTSVLEQDNVGLYFEAPIFATTEAIDIATVIAGRFRTGASFQFDFGEITEDDDGVEHLHSFSEIYELGPAPKGANPKAYAELVELDDESETQPEEPEPAEEPEPEPITDESDEAEEAALAATMWAAVARLRGVNCR